MRVGFVGGVERSEPLYERVAAEAGHEAIFHDGHVNNGGGGALARFLDRCDVVVILTDVNSHGAVQFARRHLRSRGRSPLLVRRLGLTRFAELIHSLSDGASSTARVSAS